MSCSNGTCRRVEEGKRVVYANDSCNTCVNDGSFIANNRCCIVITVVLIVIVIAAVFLGLLAKGIIPLSGGTDGAPGHKRRLNSRDLEILMTKEGFSNSSIMTVQSDESEFINMIPLVIFGVMLIIFVIVVFMNYVLVTPKGLVRSDIWDTIKRRISSRNQYSLLNDSSIDAVPLKQKFVSSDGFELFIDLSNPYHWQVNSKFGTYLVTRWDRTRGCLFINLDTDVSIIREWAQIYGIDLSLSIAGSNIIFSGPVVWSCLYANSIKLGPDVKLLIDLDHYGERIIDHGNHALGFCSPQFNFKAISISVVRTASTCKSATDIQMFGFIIRTGELGLLLNRPLSVLSKDKVFESANDIIKSYVAP